MQGRICLITGGTSGIGRATAIELARRGATVLITGRDSQRLAAALTEIRAASPSGAGRGMVADHASLASVRTCAASVLADCPRLDVLINNAGQLNDRCLTSADGYEMTFAVNHLAPLLLTLLLESRLKESAPARIAFNASTAMGGADIDKDDLQAMQWRGGWQAYANSKLANFLTSNLLAERLRTSGVVCNSFCPGLIDTGLIRSDNAEFGAARVGQLRNSMKPPEYGAMTPVFLAADDAAAAMTGAFFLKSHGAGIKPAYPAWDRVLAAYLWTESLKMLRPFLA